MEFESLNAVEEEGRRQWVEAGRPTVPSLVVDGAAHPLLHVSQIAELLGLPAPATGSPDDAVGALAVLDAWLDAIRVADWEFLLEPTPSRGRSLRNLTVNVFHPFELLPRAWALGEFPWQPEHDAEREAAFPSHERLLEWATAAAAGWRSFSDGGNVAARDPIVTSPRGQTRFSALLSFQRWHAAYHYRQLAHSLEIDPDAGLLDGLALPLDVF